MKKLFTLFAGILAISALLAQNTVSPPHQPRQTFATPNSPVPSHLFQRSNSASRASCEEISLDYNFYNEVQAPLLGVSYQGSFSTMGALRFGDALTSFMDTFHVGDNAYIFQTFDSLAYVYLDVNQVEQFGYIPLAASTITLDSLGMVMGITGDSTKMANDSILFKISKKVGNTFTAVNTVVISGWPALEALYAGSLAGYSGYRQIPIGQSFAKGEGFDIEVTYIAKDTGSRCSFAYSFADSCGIPLNQTDPFHGAYPSPFRGKAGYGIILPSGSGGATTVLDVDNTFTYTAAAFPQGVPPVNCRYVWQQNWALFPILTVCSDYGVTIQPNKTRACPNTGVDLTAIVYGTTSTNLTFNWSATNGTLSTPNGETTTLTMDSAGNAVVILTLNDGTGDVSDTLTITNVGIGITITNSNPTSIACGGNVTLLTTTTGNIAGRTYKWSNTPPTTVANLVATLPDTYSVTVTNNSGCTASDDVVVNYIGGVTNTLNFTPPTKICLDKIDTYVNNSTNKTGWSTLWDMKNNGVDTLSTLDASFAYTAPTSPGAYTIKLTMDSAGCKFVKTKSVNVLAAAACVVGIEDITFGSSVALHPNPSTGNVTVSVNGVENKLTIKVYNVIGAEMGDFTTSDVTSTFNKSFDFSDLPNGTYLMKIQSADKSAVKRFTISR